ncbi:hypothetical protein PGAL8A_00176800 [Plasmodium gallinaceum]|uniref:Uncharacterized protein n=1 Tax=Plasmodium gallinaceum TaxID=5849 RepID=A0A1J1GRX5_PLAGA|nr:hypothetical protein PGAL8A_00176800 [Plasmodium gallinaceum]CRG94056.1 hypothetical protein PGAL8A_00176800 [Plasmodium gallinaceum]
MIKIKSFNQTSRILLVIALLIINIGSRKQLPRNKTRKNEFIISRELNEAYETDESDFEIIDTPTSSLSLPSIQDNSNSNQNEDKKNVEIENVLERELKRIQNIRKNDYNHQHNYVNVVIHLNQSLLVVFKNFIYKFYVSNDFLIKNALFLLYENLQGFLTNFHTIVQNLEEYYTNNLKIKGQLRDLTKNKDFITESVPSQMFIQKALRYHKNSVLNELNIQSIIKFVIYTLTTEEIYGNDERDNIVKHDYEEKIKYVKKSIEIISEVQIELKSKIREKIIFFLENKVIKTPEMVFTMWRQYRLNIFYNLWRSNEWLLKEQDKNKILRVNKGILSIDIDTEQKYIKDILKDYLPVNNIMEALEELSSLNMNVHGKSISFELLDQLNYNYHLLYALGLLKEYLTKARIYISSVKRQKRTKGEIKEKIIIKNNIKTLANMFQILVSTRGHLLSYKELLFNMNQMQSCVISNTDKLKDILSIVKSQLERVYSEDGNAIDSAGNIIISNETKRLIIEKIKEYKNSNCNIQSKFTGIEYVNNFIIRLANSIYE